MIDDDARWRLKRGAANVASCRPDAKKNRDKPHTRRTVLGCFFAFSQGLSGKIFRQNRSGFCHLSA